MKACGRRTRNEYVPQNVNVGLSIADESHLNSGSSDASNTFTEIARMAVHSFSKAFQRRTTVWSCSPKPSSPSSP
jgi:hypothetical protein